MTTETEGDRLYRATRAVLGAVYRALVPVKVTGAEHLPREGAVILAANHISFFDTIVLMFSVPRRTYFVGKAEYMDSWTTRRLFPAFGLIPIERSAARNAMAALGVAAKALEQGHVLGIYPEGTRSRDGLLHRGHTGVAQLALMTGAAVVPVGLVGTDRIQPIGARLPRPFRRAEIRFGPPLDPASYGGSSRRRRHLLTGDLMEAIRQLCGRPTSDDFASDEPPLIRGGNESVYQVHRVTGRGVTWRQAARFAVSEVCGRHDDARVGEVRRLLCHVERDGAVRLSTELAISVKFHPVQGAPT
ncbi:MAG: 1-acyl-sn-glycerol-3-phosphate acyltransferase [Actinomycetota bacterium]|nr:1-acyl-sn-glycerol-3-phosphate acyltransferase [Actinomycetota bacterium]